MMLVLWHPVFLSDQSKLLLQNFRNGTEFQGRKCLHPNAFSGLLCNTKTQCWRLSNLNIQLYLFELALPLCTYQTTGCWRRISAQRGDSSRLHSRRARGKQIDPTSAKQATILALPFALVDLVAVRVWSWLWWSGRKNCTTAALALPKVFWRGGREPLESFHRWGRCWFVNRTTIHTGWS